MTERVRSWRDPAGFVYEEFGRVYRAVAPAEVAQLRTLLESSWYQALVEEGTIPRATWITAGPPGFADAGSFVWLEHEVLAFPCYPHEITALQLYDAAALTLRLARTALAHGWQLKDGSAWNVLFNNGKPVFCDILSFEPASVSGIWNAYAQFCRHFVIPLLLYRELRFEPAKLFLLYRDGVPPEKAGPMLSGLSALRRPALETVTLPRFFVKQGRAALTHQAPTHQSSPALAQFLLERTFKRLQRHIEAVKPDTRHMRSVWRNYETSRDHYVDADIDVKHAFIASALEASPGASVLDLGCNAGEFSKLAAAMGNRVVAVDFDDGALSLLYAALRQHPADITPVLLDIGRPTPAVGWMNREIRSFLDRAQGKFEVVMALGLMHHLLVTERVSLEQILQMFLALGAPTLVIEWIEPQDLRFGELCGTARLAPTALNATVFESVFSPHYQLIRKRTLPVCRERTLYHWRRRAE
ncbi:MAG: class I SAM-dependent methyltransferase [Massilia sp.]